MPKLLGSSQAAGASPGFETSSTALAKPLMSSTQDFNPYEPPRFVESIAGDELADGRIFVPSWGRVIANAAIVSIFLGSVLAAAGLLINGILFLSLLILMPLSFSWHFCRTYRLPYRCVPKFGWLPWAFMVGTFILTLCLILFSLPIYQLEIYHKSAFGVAIRGAAIVASLCLAMDFSLSQYVTRKSNPKRTLLFPFAIGLASSLFWLPLAYFEDRLIGNLQTLRLAEHMRADFIITIAFAVAVFYSLIMAYPTVRERMLSAISDPRQFTKRDFQL